MQEPKSEISTQKHRLSWLLTPDSWLQNTGVRSQNAGAEIRNQHTETSFILAPGS